MDSDPAGDVREPARRVVRLVRADGHHDVDVDVAAEAGSQPMPQLPITASNLASVAHGTQFIAVGAGGTIYTSIDGVSWQPAASGVSQDLHAVVFTVLTGGSVGVGYLSVGDNGMNLTSF